MILRERYEQDLRHIEYRHGLVLFGLLILGFVALPFVAPGYIVYNVTLFLSLPWSR